MDHPVKQPVVPGVSVVLCTYNGARYLPELLASLAAQTMRIDRLVWRDDGSIDDSVNIVRNWAARHQVQETQVHEPRSRLGPARSFLTTLAASVPAEVHFLADQDDVWLPTKVERAVEALRRVPRGPVLYASRQQIVDAALQPLALSTVPTRLSLRSAVCESLLTGCTMAFNEDLRLLAAREVSEAVLMHDWWLYLLASATGQIVFDEQATLLYRQHSLNVIGARPVGIAAWMRRLNQTINGPAGGRREQLRAFERIYGDVMTPEAVRLVRKLVGGDRTFWTERCRVALQIPIVRQTWLESVGTRLSIMRNRF